MFGRNRPTRPSPHPSLSKYVNLSTLPTPPETFKPPQSADYSAAAIPVAGAGLQDIYGNDVLGDCTAAWYAHQINIWTGNSGTIVLPTLDQVIAFYSACSGYVPGDPSTDRGADELTVLEVAKSVGLAGRKIQGAFTVDATSPELIATCIWLFGGATICIELPDAWVAPGASEPGSIWDVAGSPNPNQGHCFGGCGYDKDGIFSVTWGKTSITTPSRLTWRAAATYGVTFAGGSLFGMLSTDWLNAKGAAPNGLDLEQLTADAALVGGAV